MKQMIHGFLLDPDQDRPSTMFGQPAPQSHQPPGPPWRQQDSVPLVTHPQQGSRMPGSLFPVSRPTMDGLRPQTQPPQRSSTPSGATPRYDGAQGLGQGNLFSSLPSPLQSHSPRQQHQVSQQMSQQAPQQMGQMKPPQQGMPQQQGMGQPFQAMSQQQRPTSQQQQPMSQHRPLSAPRLPQSQPGSFMGMLTDGETQNPGSRPTSQASQVLLH